MKEIEFNNYQNNKKSYYESKRIIRYILWNYKKKIRSIENLRSSIIINTYDEKFIIEKSDDMSLESVAVGLQNIIH